MQKGTVKKCMHQIGLLYEIADNNARMVGSSGDPFDGQSQCFFDFKRTY